MLKLAVRPAATDPFQYLAFDARPLLPAGWQEDLTRAVALEAEPRWLYPKHTSSRETKHTVALELWALRAGFTEQFPWLGQLYRGPLLEAAQCFAGAVPLVPANGPYGVALNVSRGNRGEVHVDTNEVQGLLCLAGDGPLVVGLHPHMRGVEQVDLGPRVLLPHVPGRFYVFRAQDTPHYARPNGPWGGEWRINADLNYYAAHFADGVTEDMRPADLSAHLAGVRRSPGSSP